MSNQQDDSHGADLDIDISTFADLVEDQHNNLMAMLDSPDPAAQFMRSMLGDEFLAEKDAEMTQYVNGLRTRAARQEQETQP